MGAIDWDAEQGWWWQHPGVAEHRIGGVFEGGGAKGVAYAGALEGVLHEKCWFSAVAGASAGAITAALVAAGLRPEQIREQVPVGLGHVKSGWRKAAARLRDRGGLFPHEKLLEWLDRLLAEQVAKAGIERARPDAPVTFRELYTATQIELNIVGANISLGKQIVFSHHDTPHCQVADAVVASCAIPFAFESAAMIDWNPDGAADKTENQPYFFTMVDGGVWSNFPMFVFEDETFRAETERPDPPPPIRVGFLLDEGEPERPNYDEIRFIRDADRERLRVAPIETRKAEPESVGFGRKAIAAGLWVLGLPARLARGNAPLEPARWHTPRAPELRGALGLVDGTLCGVRPLGIAALSWMVMAAGAFYALSALITGALGVRYAGPSGDLVEYGKFGFYAGGSGLIVALVVFVTLSVLLVLGLGLVINHYTLLASRRLLYGLVRTFVAAPGAPSWATRRKDVIALPIRGRIGMLDFDASGPTVDELIAEARSVTISRLREIVSASSASARGGTRTPTVLPAGT